MLTPAQNPRGLARMIFTDTTLLIACIVQAPSHPAKRGPGNGIATRGRVAMRGRHSLTSQPSLLELDLADGDDLLAVLLGDRAGHLALHGAGADLLVVLLAAVVVEVVDGAVLGLDDG